MPPCGVYGRDVGLFAPSHVSIIALAAFIVEADDTLAVHAVGGAVLVVE